MHQASGTLRFGLPSPTFHAAGQHTSRVEVQCAWRVALHYFFEITMNIITAQLLEGTQRVSHTASVFGINFPFKLEPTVFAMADRLAPAYNGGFWDFYELSNQGFYMAPASGRPFKVQSMNGFEGNLSADALGITACLFAYSQLSFGADAFAELMAEHYHRLRHFALAHHEAGAVLAVID